MISDFPKYLAINIQFLTENSLLIKILTNFKTVWFQQEIVNVMKATNYIKMLLKKFIKIFFYFMNV